MGKAAATDELRWFDCTIVAQVGPGHTRQFDCEFLCLTAMEAQLKSVRFLQNEGLALKSIRVIPRTPKPDEKAAPPWEYSGDVTELQKLVNQSDAAVGTGPWVQTEDGTVSTLNRTEPKGEIVPEQQRAEALRSHFYGAPVVIKISEYTGGPL